MKLSPQQQRPLWTMLAAAWAMHCEESGARVTDSKAKEAWRHDLLKAETGFDSLTKVPRSGAAFVKFMAALEVIARNGIFWQMRLYGAETRPVLHGIMEVIEKHGLDHDYVAAIATKALSLDEVPSLDKLSLEQALNLLAALKRTCASLTRKAVAS